MLDIGLVDDQQLVRQGIAGLLAISGHARVLWEARNGEEALALIAQQPVNALLADIRMPVMDGIGLVKQLRSQQNFTPVLMLTTFDDAELFSQSLAAGANGFLLKDVSLEKLISSLQAIVTGSTFLAEPELLRDYQQKKIRPGIIRARAANYALVSRWIFQQRNCARDFSGRRHSAQPHFQHTRQTRLPRPHPGSAQSN